MDCHLLLKPPVSDTFLTNYRGYHYQNLATVFHVSYYDFRFPSYSFKSVFLHIGNKLTCLIFLKESPPLCTVIVTPLFSRDNPTPSFLIK